MPPVVYDNPPFLPTTRGRVLMMARHRPAGSRGRTVLKNGSTYTLLDNPTVDQVNSATVAYLGGHIYEITREEYDALTAAGFTPWLSYPGRLLTESGLILKTEDGKSIMTEYTNVAY